MSSIPPTAHIRIARPSRDLAAAETFYVDGLGMRVLYRTESVAGDPDHAHDLLMVGWPEAGWHLELVRDPVAPVEPQPTVEDLLVVYLDGSVDEEVVARLERSGGRRVASHNPYWDRYGVTIEDGDGYRFVLCERRWSNADWA